MQNRAISAIESEAGVIATLIHHPDFFYISDELKAEHFVSTQNRTLYIALEEMIVQGITKFDAYMIHTTLDQLYAVGENVELIEVRELNDLVSNSEAITRNCKEEYLSLVSNILNCAARRELSDALYNCQMACMDTKIQNIQEYVTKTIDDAIAKHSTVKDIPLYGDVLDQCWNEILKRQNGKISGIPFNNYPSLNQFCTLEKGELLCIAAENKVGKSMMLTSIAVDLLRQNKRVLYIDSEISTVSFTTRLMANLSGIPYGKIKNGGLTEAEEIRLNQVMQWVKGADFIHVYVPDLNQETILNLVKRAHHQKPLDVFIIDYFKSTGDSNAFENSMKMGNLINTCKNTIAGAMEIACIGACQLNRDGTIAESQKIGRYVSTMMTLKNKSTMEMEAEGYRCGNKKLRVILNRNGPQHFDDEWIDIDFVGEHCDMHEAVNQHHRDTPWDDGNQQWG